MMAKDKKPGVGLPSEGAGMNKTYGGSMDPPGTAKGDVEQKAPSPQQKSADARKKREADQKTLATARKRFKRCLEAEDDNRKKAVEDLKFKAGDQWPADVAQQRSNDKRPCLTINVVPTLVHQVSNDLRQNRPSIIISPVGGVSDKEGAKAYAGMIRAIERDSQAEIAYDTGITSAVDIGFGYWRINTKYEKPNSFNQVITIERIRNAFRVYLDPERQEPDGSDMRYAFISDRLGRDTYRDQYPGAHPLGWTERGAGDDLQQWIEKDFVRIAEYFSIETSVKTLVQLSSGVIGYWEDLDESVKAEVTAGKIEVLNQREAQVPRVMWRKITGLEILEEREWIGRWIPIVEVLGEEIDIQGKVVRSGLIRNVKDAQRMKNYWATAKTEMVALAPKAPWVGAEGQFEGHESEWEQAHQKMFTKLEYVPVSLDGHPVPPPARQQPVGVSQGIVEAEQSSSQDMLATTGVRFDGTAQDRLYDESGRALREVRRNVDIGSFHFMDNACRSLRHTGVIIIDLVPKVYDVKRVVTVLREDDSEEQITLDPEAGQSMSFNPQAKNQAGRKIFDPTIGEYGVTVTTGPSYATKRIEASEMLMQFARALPQQAGLISHLIMKYSDWPGADEAYKVLTKALPPNLLSPDLRDLPPPVSNFIQSLMGQIKQLMVERMAMLKDLTDQKGDRQVRQNKIDRDFESKMLKMIVDAKTKMVELSREDVRDAVAITDETRPPAIDGATGGGVAPGAPTFPAGQPVLPAVTVAPGRGPA